MDGKSINITEELKAQLKALFPEIFSEDKIDLQRLKVSLGEETFVQGEHYELSWNGKTEARKEIQKQTTSTLIPDINNSINFDTAQNVFIEGENLEVLRVLQKSYFGKIKMIYIDPPYNTGNDSFIYPDDYAEREQDYDKKTGKKNVLGFLNKQDLWKRNIKENGHFHSAWLSMMYPRLYLSRNLLKDDGLIFISIDDNEQANLKMLCDEIFGEENFVGGFVWRRKVGAGADSRMFFRQHEHILLYGKNLMAIQNLYQPLTKDQEKEYSNPDNDPRGDWASTDLSSPAHDNDPRRIYDIVSPTGKVSRKCWAYTKENFDTLLKENLVWWGKDGNSMPKRKRFLNEKKGLTPRSWIDNILTQDGKKNLELLGFENYFEYPKPVKLIKHFLTIVTSPKSEDIVLDFFAGSGSTAQAVLELNNEDEGNRKFICVQIPEPNDTESEAYKANYKTIADVTKARIIKVIEDITKAKNGKLSLQVNNSLNLKSFKLSESNFKIWRTDIQGKENILEQLNAFQQSEKKESEHINMLIELFIKIGLELNISYKYEEGFYKANTLWVCFEKFIPKMKDLIFKGKPQKLIFLNSCFKTDEAITNFKLEIQELQISLTLI